MAILTASGRAALAAAIKQQTLHLANWKSLFASIQISASRISRSATRPLIDKSSRSTVQSRPSRSLTWTWGDGWSSMEYNRAQHDWRLVVPAGGNSNHYLH
jgi:hypothetical protein